MHLLDYVHCTGFVEIRRRFGSHHGSGHGEPEQFVFRRHRNAVLFCDSSDLVLVEGE
jgi:hypothetical protein